MARRARDPGRPACQRAEAERAARGAGRPDLPVHDLYPPYCRESSYCPISVSWAMNIGVIGRRGGEVPRPGADGVRLPVRPADRARRARQCLVPAANHRGIKAESRERARTRGRTGLPAPACASPRSPARYQFNCTFAGWHPEIRGANRSGRERASRAAIPRNSATVSPGTSGKYGWRPVTLLPGTVACADAAAGTPGHSCCTRRSGQPANLSGRPGQYRAMPARAKRRFPPGLPAVRDGRAQRRPVRNQTLLDVPRPGRHPDDRRGDLPRRVVRQEDVPDGRLDVPGRILRWRC